METKRNIKIKKLYKKVRNYREVAKKFNISHQRVHQIVTGYFSPASRFRVILNPKDIKILTKRKREYLGLPNVDLKLLNSSRDKLREIVRARDKYTCKKCHKKWKKNTRRFDVHHLDKEMDGKSHYVGITKYDRENLDRLITLCHKCHFNLDETKSKIRLGRVK